MKMGEMALHNSTSRLIMIVVTTLFCLLVILPQKVASSGQNDVERGLNKGKSIFTTYCYKNCTTPDDEERAVDVEDHTLFKEENWRLFQDSKCNGSYQSPIDIQTSQVWNKDNPINIDWRFFHHYNMYHSGTIVRNDGILFLIDSKELKHVLSFSVHYGEGEEDVAVYYLNNIHIHWGKHENEGSEHAIDGKRYAAEVHMVHTKEDITLENYKNKEAGRLGSKHDNIFIVTVLLEQGERSENFAPIENVLGSKLNSLSQVQMGRQFSMFALMSKSLARNSVYYSYHGSLTGPLCDEVVTWAVFKDPLQVSKKQLDTLRNSMIVQYRDRTTGNMTESKIANNFRNLQKANGRNITAYIPHAVMIGGPPVKGNTSIPGMSLNFYAILSILLMLIFANNI